MSGTCPYVLWNMGTERYELLYVKKGFRDLYTESWSVSVHEQVIIPDGSTGANAVQVVPLGVACKLEKAEAQGADQAAVKTHT